MRKISFLPVSILLAIGCQHLSTMEMQNIEFLTREGCVNTPVMKANLDAAIATSNVTYTIIQQDDLAKDDPRTGYPTPTILVDSRDLFGLPKPISPYPTPT